MLGLGGGKAGYLSARCGSLKENFDAHKLELDAATTWWEMLQSQYDGLMEKQKTF